jgi:CheY-like chemotaxis protein
MAHHELFAEILIIEDNPADVDMIRETLRESKIANNLSVVSDGEVAMDFLHKRGEYAAAPRPDLILLDIILPKKSGLEVLAEVKADPDLRRIPIIVLTSSKAEEDIFKSYDLHANSYISKPVHLSELFQVIRGIEDFWFGIVKLPSR